MKKATRRFQYLALHLLTLSGVMAAAPTNDLFGNRTQLEGTRVEMSGAFLGATLDAGEPAMYVGDASVWWSWVAPASGLVLLDSVRPHVGGMMCVTTATNIENVAAAEDLVTTMPIGLKRYATFKAEAGKEYQIGAFGVGWHEGDFQLRMSMTNPPIILEGPVTRTISPGGSALFTVAVAVGESGKARIQWQFEGADILKETGAMLVRTNASVSMGGEYRAIVNHTDSGGNLTVRTSSIARLNVSAPQSPRLLLSEDPAEPGVLLISVIGEPGRWYDFASFRSVSEQGSMGAFYPVRFESPLRLPANQSQAFFHVRVFEASSPACWLNLQRMHFAKQRVAADLKMINGAAHAVSLVLDRLGYIPECPEGGIYTYGSMDVYPICSLQGHVLGYDD